MKRTRNQIRADLADRLRHAEQVGSTARRSPRHHEYVEVRMHDDALVDLADYEWTEAMLDMLGGLQVSK